MMYKPPCADQTPGSQATAPSRPAQMAALKAVPTQMACADVEMACLDDYMACATDSCHVPQPTSLAAAMAMSASTDGLAKAVQTQMPAAKSRRIMLTPGKGVSKVAPPDVQQGSSQASHHSPVTPATPDAVSSAVDSDMKFIGTSELKAEMKAIERRLLHGPYSELEFQFTGFHWIRKSGQEIAVKVEGLDEARYNERSYFGRKPVKGKQQVAATKKAATALAAADTPTRASKRERYTPKHLLY